MTNATTAKVDLLYPYTDKAGKKHEAGKPAELPVGEASELVYLGRAAYTTKAEAEKASAPTKEAAK